MKNSPTYPDCPTALSEEQLNEYWETGYLAFENALSPEEVEQAREDLRTLFLSYAFNEDVAEFNPASKEKTNYSGASFKSKTSPCWVLLEPGFDPDPNNVEEVEQKVRKTAHFQDESVLFKSLYTSHPKVMGTVKSVLGNALELYQSMALVKPANGGVEKPWHQDNAYFCVESLDQVVGVWIALDDASAENGCMHVLAKGHRLGPLKHHHTFDCEILPDRFDRTEALPIELKAGGMLLFHSNLPHQTPVNNSSERRRALQYHYRSSQNSVISTEEYFKVFKEADGTPASCMAAVPENF
ncbi:phytanoyl-CoA dioxygenase family protein [Opitutia bacterium ISCC 51]|nr:phytanoyl-CoA dioxygenase family protein [Opitutae bacterium ISCC 51]QXD29575.1 phytanoyl-CoA dioxygenase family protein [Opitutae bacterium ISCC 52]